MLSIYLAPDRFGADGFLAQATDFADHVRQSAAAVDGVVVAVPGDIEQAQADEQRANGIDLADGTWADLTLTAAKVGVTLPAI
jgi:LDH2 family malate/lactate/ureidoglycolate dehydrogenase